MPTDTALATRASRAEIVALGFLFGSMYFAQGISEPSEGLIAQPVRSLLKDWGHSPGDIGVFGAIVSLPWALKPLYGLLTDFVPLAGTRRRGYLLLMSVIATVSLAILFLATPQPGQIGWLLVLLVVPCMATAFADVVIDALMVEKGQPLGLTGRLQSIQWACMYLATILAGLLGGWFTQHRLHRWGFLTCALATGVTALLTLAWVREPRSTARVAEHRSARAVLGLAIRSPGVWVAGAFLFLWNFNPFSTSVLYEFMIGELGMSEQFYGTTVSVLAAGAVVGSLSYGLYCRAVPFPWLIHLSIVGGMLSTLAYWAMSSEPSALVVSFVVGWMYITGTLVQFDFAARVCPVEAAGTTLAVLMALANLSMALSAGVGGYFYEHWADARGGTWAFRSLVALGALCTATCWFVVPYTSRRTY
jgi:MFS family permease